MKIVDFIKKVRNIRDNALSNNGNAKIMLKIGKAEYEIEYVMTNEKCDACILKLDDLAELDLVYRIIEANNKKLEVKNE